MLSTSKELVRRDSIAELIGHRNAALEMYKRAAELIVQANRTMKKAAPSGHTPLQRHDFDWLYYSYDDANADKFLNDVRKRADQSVWRHLLQATGLGDLMDATAKRQFEDQLEKEPPVCTVETVCATMLSKAADAGNIFERGLVEAFRKLNRGFATNNGFKIGPKIIMKGALEIYRHNTYVSAHWNHYSKADDTIADVERTFHILDGKQPCGRYAGIASIVDKALQERHDTAENEYFFIKICLNGNVHITFKRQDLLDKANQIIAKHCGAVVPDATKTRRETRR